MAIPRVSNSNTPFIEVKGASLLSSLAEGYVVEVEEDLLVQTVLPTLSLVMEQGTAKQVVTGTHNNSDRIPCVSIIAQAEGEASQEFSPTSTECVYSRYHLLKSQRSIAKTNPPESDTDEENYVGTARKVPRHRIRRKLRRRAQEGRPREEGQEPPVIQGLWVQEIDWSKSTNRDMSWASDTSQHTLDSPVHKFSTRDPQSPGDCLEGASRCVDGLSDIFYELTGVPDSSSESVGGTDSPCSLKSISDSESIHTHEGGSDSVCSLVDVSDCLSSVMCVSDDFLAPVGTTSACNSSCSLMGVSDAHSRRSSSSEEGASSSFCGLVGVSDAHSRRSSSSEEGASSPFCGLVGVSDIRGMESGSLPSGASNSETLKALRGRVTPKDQRFISPFFKELVEDISDEKKEVTSQINEGLILHKQLRPEKFKYREGKEYHILYHIQNGSYGDVFSVQDKQTRFQCAAKKIPLGNFNCEEVSTWSALNSPGVVKLFGAVREGPYITLFMDLKTGCLAQLLREKGHLPEETALYYFFQLLGALEHLHHRKVLHLDVKVDNVLLSADGRDTFLCDFGLSETLDSNGQSTKAFRQSGWPAGTETHMAPEVARGDPRCVKADVWSSCCMLLHMLNGCHPWIRYYNRPLCFKIVNEPPPLREVPPECNPYTAEVFRAGLQKEPTHRASATELRKITNKALRAVGCLSQSSGDCQKLENIKGGNYVRPNIPYGPSQSKTTQSAPTMQWVSPWRVLAADADSSDSEKSGTKLRSVSKSLNDSFVNYEESRPKSLEVSHAVEDWESEIDSEVDIYLGEDEYPEESSVFKTGNWEFVGSWEEEESEWDHNPFTELSQALHTHFPVLWKSQPENDQYWGSEPELEHLRDGPTMGRLAQTLSPEPRDHPPSCMSSTGSSHNDTGKDSDPLSDDLSSGVFSYSSQTEGQSFNLEWVASSTNRPPSYCFEGIEIWIENIDGECLRIRERRQVKVGHVAIGISEQITVKAFSLETLDRKPISFSQEIKESGFWLRCVIAPDCCPRWSWRVKDRKLEIRE
ncbi:mitogen-activated protein kinase kinase kinase 14 isoform X2 [Esox lucius]|uniref:mitogen-activated protein kinase kinase kinase 14 isoform X2 n=1 Tax=Esox lucius TaxID=8010 RepID=UPI001476D7BB|nr:mitogen-activated protein kinase kinase kinase 14 isoform X2 [Esox lucius]